jgi:nitric oxide reductase NorD protein
MATPPPGRRALSLWLLGLWNVAPRLATLDTDDAQARTVLSLAGARPVLHLPATGDAQLTLARSAHAAAHLAHAGAGHARAKLKPVQRALLETLEDARVEWLAMQTLPGLRSLWSPFHIADAGRGMGFDALLARLARALFDPSYVDPHAWIARVRGMFFTPDGRLALDTPQRLRDAASRLGHDIGQMRLPFNPAGWRIEPVYRDDNHHLWAADDTLPPSATELEREDADSHGGNDGDDAPTMRPPPQAIGGGGSGDAAATALWAEAPLRLLRYPEWDRLIGRLRPDWCTLIETRPAAGDTGTLFAGAGALRLRSATHASGRPERRRSHDGEHLHTDALIDAGIALRARIAPPQRLQRAARLREDALDIVLLIDTSASTAAPGADGRPLLAALREAALLAAAWLDARGHRVRVQAFASDTRHRVRVQRIKEADDGALDAAVLARAAGLRSAGSTRMGAPVRHALSQLDGARRHIVLLTDGEPHDIDIHDPRYLAEDLARAVREAWHSGVTTGCLCIGDRTHAGLSRLFAPGGCVTVPDGRRLAQTLCGFVAARPH